MPSLEGSQEWQREPSVWLLEVKEMIGERGGHSSPSSEGVGGGCTAEEVLADLAWVTLQHFHLDWIKLPIILASQEIGKTCG